MALEGFTIGQGGTQNPGTPKAPSSGAISVSNGALKGFTIGGTAAPSVEAPAPVAAPAPEVTNLVKNTPVTIPKQQSLFAKAVAAFTSGKKADLNPADNFAPKTTGGTQSFLSAPSENARPANSLQNALSSVPGIGKKVVTSSFVQTLGDVFDDTVNRIQGAVSSLGNWEDHAQPTVGTNAQGQPVDQFGTRTTNSSVLQRVASGTQAVTGIANLAFSPISAGFKQAEKIPVAGLPFKALDFGFEKLGQVMTYTTGKAVDALPISKEAKDTIRGPLSEVTSLIAQIYVGKVALEKGLPIAKEKMADIQTKLTKDIVEHNIPGKTVTIEPTTVHNILSGVLSKGEVRDLYLALGRSVEQIKTDIKQGVSIEVPKQSFIQLIDKPYWSKIKMFFGFPEAEPINISFQGGQPTGTSTVRYLPKPGEATPEVLKQEIATALETNSPDVVRQALQEEIGVSPAIATQLVSEAQSEAVLKDPAKTAQEVLQLTAPEKSLQLGPGEAHTKFVVDETPEQKAIADKAYEQTKANGGVTISLGGDQPAEGFSFAPDKTTERSFPETEITEQDYLDYINDHKDLLEQEGNHLGSWTYNGRTYLDVSRVGKPSPETIAEAQKGKQLAVYDLGRGKEIPTGKLAEDGKGEYTPIDEASNIYDQYQREVSGASSEGGVSGAQEVSPGKPEVTSGGEKIKPVGGSGERIASKLAGGIEARAIENKLLTEKVSDLSTHERAVMKDQREAATELFNTDKERAIRVALGQENPPEGMLSSVIFQKVVEQAEKAGDIDLIRQLATSDYNDTVAAFAQNLRGLAEFRNAESPTEIIKQVSKARKARVEGKIKEAGSLKEAKKKVVADAKKTIAKRTPKIKLKDVQDFINLLEC